MAERVLVVPYKEAARDIDLLLNQAEAGIRDPGTSASQRKQLRVLRDKLLAHRAESQMALFATGPEYHE